jgi:hypothetical protein
MQCVRVNFDDLKSSLLSVSIGPICPKAVRIDLLFLSLTGFFPQIDRPVKKSTDEGGTKFNLNQRLALILRSSISSLLKPVIA